MTSETIISIFLGIGLAASVGFPDIFTAFRLEFGFPFRCLGIK